MLTRDGSTPTNLSAAKAVLGIWGGASRRKVRVIDDHGNGDEGKRARGFRSRASATRSSTRSIVPVGDKDRWNAVDPIDDDDFEKYVNQPELAKLLPILYPGVFPNLAGYTKTGRTCTRSCSPGFRAESSRGSRTSPARIPRTCCG